MKLGSRHITDDGVKLVLVDYNDPRVRTQPSWAEDEEDVRANMRLYTNLYVHGDLDITPRFVYWVKDDGPEVTAPVTPQPAPLLTQDKKARKEMPIARGVVDYFPRALAAIANVSFVANQQHNPGEPMHWDKSKSTDHADCIARHLIERGTVDDDGLRHSAKLAWRALALLETELSEQK